MKSITYSLMLALILALTGCKIESDTGNPTVITSPAERVLWTEVLLGGNVTSAGTELINDVGFWWGTGSNPQSTGQKLSKGGGPGVFSFILEGLTEKTTYYYQAFASSLAGIGYGEVLSFMTGGVNESYTDPRNGSSYPFTTIGTQTWMIRNMDYLPSVNPSADESETQVRYLVYDYEGNNVTEAKASENYTTYGTLYNWMAALSACPAGWHLPTDQEWKTMEIYLGMTQQEADEEGDRSSIGKQLKNITGWSIGNISTNSAGFSVIPGGFTYPGGQFGYKGVTAQFWTATESDASQAWTRILNGAGSGIERRDLYKNRGYSVRCLKDK